MEFDIFVDRRPAEHWATSLITVQLRYRRVYEYLAVKDTSRNSAVVGVTEQDKESKSAANTE